jgi:hypothetical protein
MEHKKKTETGTPRILLSAASMAYLIWSFVVDTISSDWIQILNKTCNTSVLLLDLPGQHVVLIFNTLRPLVGRNYSWLSCPASSLIK